MEVGKKYRVKAGSTKHHYNVGDIVTVDKIFILTHRDGGLQQVLEPKDVEKLED